MFNNSSKRGLYCKWHFNWKNNIMVSDEGVYEGRKSLIDYLLGMDSIVITNQQKQSFITSLKFMFYSRGLVFPFWRP